MHTPSNKDLIQQFTDETLNGGDIDATAKFFAPNVVEAVPLPGQGPGLDGLKDVLRGMRTAFPDMHWELHEQIAEADTVVTRFEWTGTHRAPFMGVPPTNRPVKVWSIVIDRFHNGKIAHTRNAYQRCAARRPAHSKACTYTPFSPP